MKSGIPNSHHTIPNSHQFCKWKKIVKKNHYYKPPPPIHPFPPPIHPFPPPSKAATAVKGGAPPTDNPNPQPVARKRFGKSYLHSIRFIVTVLILSVVWRNIQLGFELDSVSVSIHDDPSLANVTAVWDLGFSTERWRWVRDLNVSVRFMSREFQLETRDFQGEAFGAANSNATVSTVLPPDFIAPSSGGIVLEKVMFECNFEPRYGVKAACENVTVEYSSDEAKWIMKGGPMSCPFVRYGRVYFFSYEFSFDKILAMYSRLTNK